MRSIWSFAPRVNLAAPGAIGGTTAGSGAFTMLTVNNMLGVTQATTLSGGLTVGGSSYEPIISTNYTLYDWAGSSVGTLTNAPYSGNPTKWIGISDAGVTRYIPTWEPPP